MELLGISTIIGYIISIYSLKYVLTDTDTDRNRIIFDLVYFIILVLFSLYVYSMIGDFSNKLDFLTSLLITFLIINFLFFLFMFTRPIQHLGLIILPLSLIILIVSMIFSENQNLGTIPNELRLHIIVSITSYGFLGLAAAQAILLNYQEKKLKRIKNSLFITILPSIEKMEQVMFELVILGFIFLTISLLSGAPFIKSELNTGLHQKIIFSLIAWITYLYLIYNRFSVGIRGKKANNLALSGMVFLFIAYLGTKLFFISF